MALTVNIVGQGTVQQQVTAISETFTPTGSNVIYTYDGDAYTLTARHAVGWRFYRWTYSCAELRYYSSDGGASWRLLGRVNLGGGSRDNPITSTIQPGISSYEGNPRLFEGDLILDYTYASSNPNDRFKYIYDAVTITAEFELVPVADGPILRSDAGVILRSDAGVIMRQG